MRADAARFLARNRWVWAAIGVLVLWASLSLLTERVSLHALSGVAASAAFLLIAALGQMLVVTTGRGNIDLSIPSVITLSAYVTVIVSGGQDANLRRRSSRSPRSGSGPGSRTRPW
jgi:ribose transport system permease protein